MQKFTLLFVVLCAVVLIASAAPAKKGHKKSAKIVRASSKAAKLVKAPRRSGKIQVHAAGHGHATIEFPQEHHIHHEPHHVHHEPHHEVKVEIPLVEELTPAVEDEIIEEVLETLPEEEILELAAEEIAHEIEEAVEAKEEPIKHNGAQYFNTNFGQTQKGSIALANSYSTGQKGAATSHATSYGQHH